MLVLCILFGVTCCFLFFFFFKQKTAYEMRISDWSSDVCSSDLVPFPVMHVDTGKKFKEMYEFRDRYAAEWELDFKRETCPPLEEIDASLPPAARRRSPPAAGDRKSTRLNSSH